MAEPTPGTTPAFLPRSTLRQSSLTGPGAAGSAPSTVSND